MQFIQTRRELLTSLTAAGALGLLGGRPALAADGPPETTTIRIRFEWAPLNVINGVAQNTTCNGPAYITEELLSAEGFTDIRYVPVKSGPLYTQAFAAGDIDFGLSFVPNAIRRLDAGVPITVLAGVHPGCLNLFAQEPIRAFTDLKDKQVGINEGPGSADYLFVSIMAAHVGLDPEKDIRVGHD
jgi:NitT/TauT family transport system substrate-binding protein